MAETATRRGGRAAAIDQMPFAPPVNRDRPTEPLTEAGIAALHDGAMRILEEIGIAFPHQEALAALRAAGGRVAGERVRMGRDFVMEMLARAPSEFTLTPRNPDHRISLGGDTMLFGNVASPPNCWDMETGRKRAATRDDCANLLRLTQFFNCIHFVGGYPVEPADIPAGLRHLEVLHDGLTLTDKVMHAYSLGRARVEEAMEMVRIAGGLSEAAFEASPRMFSNINSSTPLRYDHATIDGCLPLVRRGQAVVVTPLTLAGATAPAMLAGAVAQSLAEALGAIALFQALRPGAPCVIGTFTSNVDPRSGAPVFGTPEQLRATQMTGQMARFYGLPLRASGVCSANVPDGQAMWETAQSLWAAVQSGSHMVYHAAGWLEGGLIASPEKFIMDCEVLQQIQHYMQPQICATGPAEIALDTVRVLGTTGRLPGLSPERQGDGVYRPILSDWRGYEDWQRGGGLWTAERAHLLFREILADFAPPPMDAAIREELGDFVARRRRAHAAPADA
ncbi:MAG: trimethylamine methyltransferase family protein [Pseudodonghicola sp.]